MAREIKFRAWDAENNEMVYDVNLNDGKPVKPGFQWFSPQNTVHDADPMQYTGLKDKNGVEIYEGDVCRVINPNGDEDKACHVDFDSISSCYTYSPEDGYGDYDISSIGWAMQLGFEFEVIGNIHQNPELLEGR